MPQSSEEASVKLPISNLGLAKLVGGQGSGSEKDPLLTSLEPIGESKHSLLCLSNTELVFHICNRKVPQR